MQPWLLVTGGGGNSFKFIFMHFIHSFIGSTCQKHTFLNFSFVFACQIPCLLFIPRYLYTSCSNSRTIFFVSFYIHCLYQFVSFEGCPSTLFHTKFHSNINTESFFFLFLSIKPLIHYHPLKNLVYREQVINESLSHLISTSCIISFNKGINTTTQNNRSERKSL